jgi:small subunit ribosomal protein S6
VRRYETVYILRPDLGEAQIKETAKRFEAIIASGGGELIERDEWGVRELTYNIKRERRGYYIRLDYVAPSPVVNEVERNLKLADNVLRYLSVLVSPEADAAALRGEIEARDRRIAEARAASAAAAASSAEAEKTAAPEVEPQNSSVTEPEKNGADQG